MGGKKNEEELREMKWNRVEGNEMACSEASEMKMSGMGNAEEMRGGRENGVQ